MEPRPFHTWGSRWGAVLVAVAWAAWSSPARTADSLTVLGAEPTGSRRIVTEAEWAADLVQVLGLAETLPAKLSDQDHFALLCADRAELVTQGDGRQMPARAALRVVAEPDEPRGPGQPVRLVVSVPATALYLLSVEGVGPQRWVVDQVPVGHMDPSVLGVAYAPVVLPLTRGPHELTATLTPRARLDRVELVAHRSLCIAPADGWQAQRPVTYDTLARTLVHALGLERNLPSDGPGFPTEGEAFETASDGVELSTLRVHNVPTGGTWARATGAPAELTYRIHLEEPGLYTLLVRAPGGGSQIWSIDGRYPVALEPGGPGGGFGWNHVVSLSLRAGEHVIRTFVSRGSGVDQLRMVRHDASAEAYLSVLARAGFPEGAADRTVTRSEAVDSLAHPALAARSERFLWRVARAPGVSPVASHETVREMPPPAAPAAPAWQPEPWR